MAIRVEIQLADGQFVTRMLHAGESVERFNQNLIKAYPNLRRFSQGGADVIGSIERADSVTQSFTGTLRQMALAATAATAALGGGKILKEIIQINSEFENMNMLMQSMSQASDKQLDAKTQVEQLRKEAMKAPFSLHSLQEAAVKLSSVGLKPLEGSLRAITDAVAAVGGGDEKLERVTLAITQMSGKGVIQLEELRQQLGEALPQATELMARSMGLTIAELLQKISTGTVAAKPALNGLFLEMERTFGGQAERMMTTFSGQITRTTALLQGLALRFGNVTQGSSKNTFFSELKKQLNDLNNFLGTEMAQNIASWLNDALVKAVQALRSFADWIIRNRGFLYDMGQAATIAFAIFMSGKLLTSVVGFFSAMINNSRIATMQFRAMSAELVRINTLQSVGNLVSGSNIAQVVAAQTATWRNYAAAQQTAINAMVGPRLAQRMPQFGSSAIQAGAAMSSFSMWTARAAAVWPVLLGGITSFLTIAPLLGMAIYGIADYFDLFGNKARNAWQELEQFGASSMKQINDAQELIDRMIKQRDALVASNGRTQGTRTGTIKVDNDPQIAALNAEIERLQNKLAPYREQALRTEAEAEKNIRLTAINDELEEIRTKYVEQQNIENAAYQENLQKLQDAHKDTEGEKKRHEDALTKLGLDSYGQRAAIFKAAIEDTQKKLVGANEQETAILKAMLADLNKRYADVLAENARFKEQGIGVTTIDPAIDFKKLEDKGKKSLEGIREESQGLIFDLKGATRQMGELQQAIASGTYGPQENATIAKLINQLKEAQGQADELNKLLDDQTRYDRDVAANKKRLQDELFEATHKNATETEKLIARYNAGFYGDAGKSVMQQKIEKIQEALSAANGQVATTHKTFIETLFSDDMASRGNTLVGWVNKLVDALQGVANGVMTVNGAMNQFRGGGSMGMSFVGPPLNAAAMTEAAKKGMLDLIAAAEGTDRGRGYNETLGYGKFTGGPVNLTEMTLNEVLALQKQMLAHPENTFNSSAVGRYQIVSKTLEGLIDKLGLDRNQKFTPELQDMLAQVLVKGREGQGIAGLRQEWEGLYRVADDTIKLGLQNTKASGTASAGGAAATSQAAQNTPGFLGGLRAAASAIFSQDTLTQLDQKMQLAQEQLLKIAQDTNKRVDFFDDLTQGAAAFKEELKAGETKTSQFIAMVERQNKDGKGAFANLVPGSAEYNKILDAAKAYDAAKKAVDNYKSSLSDAKSANEEVDRIAKQTGIDAENAAKKAANPFASVDTTKLDELNRKLDEYVEKQRIAFGEKSAEYTTAVARREQIMTAARQAFADERIASLKKEGEETRRSTLTKRQQLDLQIQDIRQATQEMLAVEGLTAERRAEIVAMGNAKIQALMDQYNASNPVAQQFKQWQDLSNNFSQLMSSAFSSLADGITGMIMGEKVDWESMLRNVLKDLVNMGIKYLMSSMMGGKMQVANAVSGGKGGSAKGGMAGGKAMMRKGGKGAGIYHSGGIVGRAGNFRRVSLASFAGAPRFHVGGMIGERSRRMMKDNLHPKEVPIIAWEGEGVFTRDQMMELAAAIGYQGELSPSGMSKHASRLQASMKKMQKYHTGGIVGKGVDLGMSSRDIPSSSLDGKSLKAMNDNRSSNMAVTNNITVNGGGGDQKTNQELAKQISRQVEESVRGMVYKEMLSQRRPGNMLGR